MAVVVVNETQRIIMVFGRETVWVQYVRWTSIRLQIRCRHDNLAERGIFIVRGDYAILRHHVRDVLVPVMAVEHRRVPHRRPAWHRAPEAAQQRPTRTGASPPTYTSPLQNLFHAVNYTIKCDGSVKFENGQDIEATFCTATTETPPAVSRFAAAPPSVIVLQAGRKAHSTQK